MLFKKNEKIGKYTVVFPHKESDYAETYRVKDADGKVKFLKLIFKEQLNTYQYDKDGSIIEVEVAKQLKHANLCEYVDSGDLEIGEHQLAYIVTEYVRGETLDAALKWKGDLSQQEIRQVMISILSALHHIHTLERPVIHNEVTVENTMLNLVEDIEQLKLIDFGAARFADLEPVTQSWRAQDLYYVANERFIGEGSVKSDLFSAGVVLYKLLFGMMPWETKLAGLTRQEQVQTIIEARNKPLTVPNVNLLEMDKDLLKIMVKALAPDPTQRFASAEEFLMTLKGEREVGAPPLSMTRMNEEKKTPMSPKSGNGFADVAGMEDLKMLLTKKIINILKNPERARKYKLQIPNGMLLYGPPGCGKSFIAEKFAEEAGYNYVFVKSSDLASIYVHGSQEKIGQLFADARKNAPVIINFDEFEALVPNRSSINNSSESGEVNEFLTQMNNCGQDGIFIIASSNRPDLIDPAVRRRGRLDHIIYVPLPDAEARAGMFEMHLKDRPASTIDVKKLADLTKDFVASDIAYIVNDAAMRAAEDDADISQELLEEVISENHSSLSKSDIQHYVELRKKMDAQFGGEKDRPRVGFITDIK